MTTEALEVTTPVLCIYKAAFYDLREGGLMIMQGAKVIQCARSADLPAEFDLAMREDVRLRKFRRWVPQKWELRRYLPYSEQAHF